MSAIRGAGLERCLQLGGWIREVSAIRGAGLERCLQLGGLD